MKAKRDAKRVTIGMLQNPVRRIINVQTIQPILQALRKKGISVSNNKML